MKITDFENLIRHMPCQQQAFRINNKVWLPYDEKKRIINQYERIKKVFGDDDSIDSIMISRNDLFKATTELDLFVIKVLMWGYPTKGRGENIENMLIPKNFDQTIEKLEKVKQKGNISIKEVEALFSDGLRLSTVSKLLYFLQIGIEFGIKSKIESYPTMILDQRVINAINSKTNFKDTGIEQFRKLRYGNGIDHYVSYLKFLNELAIQMQVAPDQIEMFLFEFGSNLKSAT